MQLQGLICEIWILYVYRSFFRSSWSITGIFIWLCTIPVHHIRSVIQKWHCTITGIHLWPCAITRIHLWPFEIAGIHIFPFVFLPRFLNELVQTQRFIYDILYFYRKFLRICRNTGIHIWAFVLLLRFFMILLDYKDSYMTFCIFAAIFK